MPKKQVFYTHVPFCLLYLHNKSATYMSCNNEVHLYNHCCSRRAKMYYTFRKCVFVVLGIQHAMHLLHPVICDLLAVI